MTVKDILTELELGPGVRHQNLWMFPLAGGAVPGVAYLSLDEAMDQHVLEITEVSESGEVPNLKVRNRGERPILILAGEEVVGAKQNRLVNATFLLAGLTTVVMPVSCVEAGRWHSRSKRFFSEKRLSSPQLRGKVERKVQSSIKAGLGFRADQGEVWDDISHKMARMRVESPTQAMAELYESYDEQIKNYTDSFQQGERQ